VTVIENARVQAVSGETVTVKMDLSGGCFGCAGRECRKNERLLRVKNGKNIPLSIGQKVKIAMPGSVPGQALAVLVPPALGFAAGFFITPLLFPGAGDGARAAAGAALIFAAAALVCFIRKRPGPAMPRIVSAD
jgi:hypothetical protein